MTSDQKPEAQAAVESAADSLFQHIAHGDEKHRAWLREQSLEWARGYLGATLDAAIAEAVAKERERCAELCETARFTGNTFPRTQLEQLRMDIAAAIRTAQERT